MKQIAPLMLVLTLLVLITGCSNAYEESRKLEVQGNRYLGEKNYDLAIEAYIQALKKFPQAHGARNNLGMAYMGKGELEKAVEAFQATLSLNAEAHPTRFNLALAYCKQGDREHADEEFAKLKTTKVPKLDYLKTFMAEHCPG